MKDGVPANRNTVQGNATRMLDEDTLSTYSCCSDKAKTGGTYEMKTSQYEIYLKMLSEELERQNIVGEILLAENARLLLDIFLQDISIDIETYFGPGKTLQEAAQKVAQREGLSGNWLTQAGEDYFQQRAFSAGFTSRGLHMYVAPVGYLLTMFLLFGDQQVSETMRELVEKEGLATREAVIQHVKAYLPKQSVPLQLQEKIERMFA